MTSSASTRSISTCEMSMSKLTSVVRQSLTPYLFWWVTAVTVMLILWYLRVQLQLPEKTMVRLNQISNDKNDKNDVIKCKITGNSSYHNSSSAIIARQSNWKCCIPCPDLILRNGYIQRFSYNCTQYSRNNLRRTGVLESLTSPVLSFASGSDCSARSSIQGSDVMLLISSYF